MCYDMIISEVKKDVKDEVATFNPRLVLRLNLMSLDLVLQNRKKAKKPIKVKSLVGLGKRRAFVCVRVRMCVHCVLPIAAEVCLYTRERNPRG